MSFTEIYRKDGETVSLYEVCEWFQEKYPEDIFVSKENPVHQMRDLAKKVLSMRKGK